MSIKLGGLFWAALESLGLGKDIKHTGVIAPVYLY